MIQLRDYQREAIDSLYAYWGRKKGNPLIVAPCGAGKSIIIAQFIREAMEYPGTRIIVISHRKELLEQDEAELRGIWPDAPTGFYSAGIGRKDRHAPIMFAGIQSVHSRLHTMDPFDLALIDEVHLVPRKQDTMYGRALEMLRLMNPKTRVVGFSATPYRLDSGLLHKGPGALFDEITYEIPVRLLIEQGHLCEVVGKRGARVADLSGVHKRGGEFVGADVERAMDIPDLTREACEEIVSYGRDRRAWLIFASGIKHAGHVRDAIHGHGIDCELVHGGTPSHEREMLIERFKSGRLRCLVNVDVLCLDEETEILTDAGFVGIDEMSSKHNIAGWRQDGGVEFAPPELIVRRPRKPGEVMISANSVAANFRVTGNHRMVIACGSGKSKTKIMTAEEMAKLSKFCIPTFGECEPEDIDAITPKYLQDEAQHIRVTSFHYRKRGYSKSEALDLARTQVTRLRSMRYKHPRELTLNECELIGIWLGDGSKSHGRFVSISQSLAYPDNVNRIDELLELTGIHASRSIRPPTSKSNNNSVIWTLARGTGGFGQTVKRGYFEIEPYLDKSGSRLLWGLNRAQLEALLKGFWLADGLHHAKKNHMYIVGTQYDLYSFLQAVCAVRGINATITPCSPPRKKNHKNQWKFSFSSRRHWSYTASSRIEVETEHKDERVWCVTSSTTFLICRRKGKVFVTGNSIGFNAPICDMGVLLRATASTALYVQIVGRLMRTYPGKANALLLDYGGNVERHGPIDMVQPKAPGKGGGDAPVKVCPVCNSLVAAGALACSDCGHMFPEREPKHDGEAYSGAVMSNQWSWEDMRPDSVVIVDGVSYHLHKKPGKPDSVRVEYRCGLRVYKDWWMPEHGGRATQQTAIKMRALGVRCPATTSELLEMAEANEIPVPLLISIKKEGKYERVEKVHP